MSNPLHTLWFEAPATDWHAALPVGNGHLGAMVFGDPVSERIQITEESIWAGPPIPSIPDTARDAIEEARQLILKGKYVEADQLILEKALGPRISPRSQQPLGDLTVRFSGPSQSADISDYRRLLDLSRGVAESSWARGDVRYLAEVFCSFPDNACVAHYSASEPGALHCSIRLGREAGATTRCLSDDLLVIEGRATHRGTHPGVRFAGVLKVVLHGGEIHSDMDTLHIDAADGATLILAVETDYNFDAPSSPLEADLVEAARTRVENVANKNISNVMERHLADHVALYNRMELQLGEEPTENLPTDERVHAYKHRTNDPALEALQFHYGRYLLIACSRPGCMPANLQGVWNDKLAAPWNADYHTNINLQMNYWPAEVTNLSECHGPLFDLMEHLIPSAQQSAAKLGCRGAFMGHVTDAWQGTAFFGRPRYGMWVMGLAWCSQHFMEHVRFTGDMKFLTERALPVLRECSLFFLDWLLQDPDTGALVSGPSTSPENSFETEEGTAILTLGCAMDQQIIWDTFNNYLEALQTAGVRNDELATQVEAALKNLALPQIGSDGRLREWPHDFGESEPGHRHVSHLFGLHPGHQYTHEDTPEFLRATEKSLNGRLAQGGGQTGWSRCWLINFRARMRDGEKAHEDVSAFIGKLTEANLFCIHPPFQIDGNFGYPAGVAEMLLQSHQRVGTAPLVNVLPALPKAWSTGSVRGIRARGGLELSFSWEDKTVQTLSIKADHDQTFVLRVNGENREIAIAAGEQMDL